MKTKFATRLPVEEPRKTFCKSSRHPAARQRSDLWVQASYWICIEAALLDLCGLLSQKDPWTLRFVDYTGFVTSRPKDFNMKSAAVGNPQDASQWQRIDAPISVMFPPFKAHIKSGKKCPLRNLKCW